MKSHKAGVGLLALALVCYFAGFRMGSVLLLVAGALAESLVWLRVRRR